ncbi:hypothetical protein AB0M47_05135 [Hamadaea sp. NPDC051192]|uniref:hypothetical protein n=1 Tax=Hamadaea sp. NPDC051192 TaxID=3154940 RepID=UPI00341D4255
MQDNPSTQNAHGDLGYLRRQHLRPGSIGLFAGDWAFTGGRVPQAFIGILVDWWNGAAVWSCSREVAEAVVADQQRMQRQERLAARRAGHSRHTSRRQVDELLAYLYFDGDDIVVDERGHHERSRICPDRDGQYIINGWAWMWQVVDPAVCDTIVGPIPTYGTQQAYEVLPHTGLRVPHDRIRVTRLPHQRRDPQIVAELTVDGELVATAEHDEGDLRLLPLTARFDADWLDFVAGCRYRGQPVGESDVVDALLTESDTDHVIAQADALWRQGLLGRRPTMYRLLDDQHRPLAVYADMPLPPDREAQIDLARQLSEQETARYPELTTLRWQYWTGHTWQYLGAVPATASQPTRPALPAAVTKQQWPVCSAARVGPATSDDYIVVADRGDEHAPARYATVHLRLRPHRTSMLGQRLDLTWAQAQRSMIEWAGLVLDRHVEVLVYSRPAHRQSQAVVFVNGHPRTADDRITVSTAMFHLDADLRRQVSDTALARADWNRRQQRGLSDAAQEHADQTLTAFTSAADVAGPPVWTPGPHV